MASNDECQDSVTCSATGEIIAGDVQVHRRNNSSASKRQFPDDVHEQNYASLNYTPTLSSNSVSTITKPVKPMDINLEELDTLGTSTCTDENQCGLFCFHPKCIQRFASPISFLISLCGVVFAQSMIVSGYLASINTTIEKRYGLTSREIGFIYSSYEATCITATLFVSYFGHRTNRAQLLGSVALLLGVGYAVFALPHFIGNTYLPTESNSSSAEGMCSLRGADGNLPATHKSCDIRTAETLPLTIFCVAYMIIGVGASPIYVLGPTYLYDSVTPRQYPIFSAFMYVSAALGPAMGFVLGGWFLSLYIDVPLAPPPSMGHDASHPLWLGAWWIGMLMCVGLVIVTALPLICFPKRLPKRTKKNDTSSTTVDEKIDGNNYVDKEVIEVLPQTLVELDEGSRRPSKGHCNASYDPDLPSICAFEESKSKPKAGAVESNGAAQGNAEPTPPASITQKKKSNAQIGKLKDLPRGLNQLFTNWVWLGVTMLTAVEQSIVTAFVAYVSKYLQATFGVPANLASLNTGAVVIPSAVVGVLLGGLIMRQFRLSITGAARLLVFLCVISSACTTALMFLGCTEVRLVGVTTHYSENIIPGPEAPTVLYNLTHTCNTQCACTTQMYKPVCGFSDGLTYFSPCHAGCTGNQRSISQNDATVAENFTSCSCLAGGKARLGKCSPDCATFIPTLVLMFIQVLVTAIGQEPAHIITLRAVSSNERSFALGIQNILVRVLAFIPAPIYFGQLFDSTCLLKSDSCEGAGACLEYDLKRLPFVWLGMVVALKGLGFLIALLTWLASRHRQQFEFNAEEEPTAHKEMGESNVSLSFFSQPAATVLNIRSSDIPPESEDSATVETSLSSSHSDHIQKF